MEYAYLGFYVVISFDWWFGSKINIYSPFQIRIIYRTFIVLQKDSTDYTNTGAFCVIE
jgi:hypothetical protein